MMLKTTRITQATAAVRLMRSIMLKYKSNLRM